MSIKIKIHKDDKILIAMIAGLFATMALGYILQIANAQLETPKFYEDQVMMCSFEAECAIIDIDNYDNKTVNMIFANHLDTFSFHDLEIEGQPQ